MNGEFFEYLGDELDAAARRQARPWYEKLADRAQAAVLPALALRAAAGVVREPEAPLPSGPSPDQLEYF